MAAVEADSDDRVIVLRGSREKAFVSDADISEYESKRSDAQAIDRYYAAVDAANEIIAAATKPTTSMISDICCCGGSGWR